MGKISQQLFEESLALFPGGVNSPVRAFGAVGGTPPFIARALGPNLWDVDDNEYIDYVGSWGPAILGHANPKVVKAVQEAAERGFSFGAPTELELRLGEMVRQFFPSMEKLRFVNSGTEAAMSAVRVARGATGKDKIIKFEGGYHGHADTLLVQAGSGAGVPKDFAKHTLVLPYNNLQKASDAFAGHLGQIAGIIVEPVAGNVGCIPPAGGFLKGLRDLCTAHKALLIFDEVMTGFRVARGGAQELYNIRPDLTCLGKIIGGGLPVGAYGGRKELMEQVAPLGKIYQAGTLSGNPLAMTAGIKTLEQLAQNGVYEKLNAQSARLTEGIRKILAAKKLPHRLEAVGSMWTLFFKDGPVQFKAFFHAALQNGIYLPPSQFEAAFVSLTHKNEEIDQTLAVFEAIL